MTRAPTSPLGLYLRQRRLAAGLSIRKTAELAGITDKELCMVELHGKQFRDGAKLVAWARAVGADPAGAIYLASRHAGVVVTQLDRATSRALTRLY